MAKQQSSQEQDRVPVVLGVLAEFRDPPTMADVQRVLKQRYPDWVPLKPEEVRSVLEEMQRRVELAQEVQPPGVAAKGVPLSEQLLLLRRMIQEHGKTEVLRLVELLAPGPGQS